MFRPTIKDSVLTHCGFNICLKTIKQSYNIIDPMIKATNGIVLAYYRETK